MQLAVMEAKKALALNEVPVGAIVIKENKVIGAGFNSVIRDHSVTAHAEINAINTACKMINNYRLVNCDLYVTLEPCHMCAKAIVDARIDNVYFAAFEPKTGSIVSIDNFFDKVMVNAENVEVKNNRHNLLIKLHQTLNCVADISRISMS